MPPPCKRLYGHYFGESLQRLLPHFQPLSHCHFSQGLGIKVKHVAFLELWLRMASLELWLEMTDKHEELLICGLGWRVLPV
ncbi:hypothetical protein DEO72_LG10g1576 [Vigna unguiculata]|uniref:Uncharacterized protein n=1 Tax=Vigna unguiculata TaxID=3917 RepID=A0A4D6N9E0_VIGUN|nr:hypothetical protein DEO72_LG10g1576 [Vigna unguiculata]